MREKTFKKPTVREIFQINSMRYPERIDASFILNLIDSGMVVIPRSYKEAVESVESLSKQGLVLLPSKLRVPKAESDYGIKSLDNLVKIDSQQVLRDISKRKDVPGRLTKEFAEEYEVTPYALIKTAVKYANRENPPIGIYWVAVDDRPRATTWMRSVAGIEMHVMKQRGDFQGEILDKKPYGRGLRVRVNSRTEEDEKYIFHLAKLPMYKEGDPAKFSDWINIMHTSNDPDADYRGLAHEKRKGLPIVWSASTIFSFYDAMVFVEKHPQWRQFQINPFPIPFNQNMIDFIDRLRLRSLVLHKEEDGKMHLEVLNKTEMDKIIGARTVMRGYYRCWFHWGKNRRRNLDYLYQPTVTVREN